MRIAILLLLLAACASPEQLAAQRAAEARQQEQAEIAYTRGLAAQCESIGYQRHTDPWRQCLMQLHAQNQQSRSALGAALLQGVMSQPRIVPSCRGLPPGAAGYARAQGDCY